MNSSEALWLFTGKAILGNQKLLKKSFYLRTIKAGIVSRWHFSGIRQLKETIKRHEGTTFAWCQDAWHPPTHDLNLYFILSEIQSERNQIILPGCVRSSLNTEIRYKIKLTLGAKWNQTGIYDKFGEKKSHHPTVVRCKTNLNQKWVLSNQILVRKIT